MRCRSSARKRGSRTRFILSSRTSRSAAGRGAAGGQPEGDDAPATNRRDVRTGRQPEPVSARWSTRRLPSLGPTLATSCCRTPRPGCFKSRRSAASRSGGLTSGTTNQGQGVSADRAGTRRACHCRGRGAKPPSSPAHRLWSPAPGVRARGSIDAAGDPLRQGPGHLFPTTSPHRPDERALACWTCWPARPLI